MNRVNAFSHFLLMTAPLVAQNTVSSPLFATGLGESSFNGTQATRHMGGLDVFTDSIHANLNNPASYGFLKVTTYSVGVNYRNNISLSSDDQKMLTLLLWIILRLVFQQENSVLDLEYLPILLWVSNRRSLSECLSLRFLIAMKEMGVKPSLFSLGVPLTQYLLWGSL